MRAIHHASGEGRKRRRRGLNWSERDSKKKQQE
jgi:hypothetical protein